MPDPRDDAPGDPGSGRLHRVLLALRATWDNVVELQERAALVDRPWEAEFLHWGRPGPDGRPRLHGRLVPPPGSHPSCTTTRGWCTCRPSDDAPDDVGPRPT